MLSLQVNEHLTIKVDITKKQVYENFKQNQSNFSANKKFSTNL